MVHAKCQRSGFVASCVTVLPDWPASGWSWPSTAKTTDDAPLTVAVSVAVVALAGGAVMTGWAGLAPPLGLSSVSAVTGRPTAAPDELSSVDCVALYGRP